MMRFETKKIKVNFWIDKDNTLFTITLTNNNNDKALRSMLNEIIGLHIELGRVKFYIGIKYKPKNENIKEVQK